MKALSFDDGIREYAANGDESRIIRICITDINLYKRVADLESEIDRVSETCRGIGDMTPDQISELDCEVKSIINRAFGSDVCTPAFGAVNCLSPVSDGQLLCAVFIKALAKQIREDVAEIQKNAKPLRAEAAQYIDDDEPAQVPDISALTDEQRKALMQQLSGL